MRKIFAIIIIACVSVYTMQAKNLVLPENPNAACAEAWQNYQKANSSSPTGNPAARAKGLSGFTFLLVGSAMIITSVPCLAVGQTRRKAALKAYNENCAPDQPVVSFYLQSSSNGLGIAMKF